MKYKLTQEIREMKLTNSIEIPINHNDCTVKGVKFPKLNKLKGLSEYKKQIAEGDYYSENVIVKKLILLDNMEWGIVACNLLNGCESWEEIGGSIYTGIDADIQNADNFLELTDEQVEEYRNNNALNVVMVMNQYTQETFYIDTQGHKYARYVGIK